MKQTRREFLTTGGKALGGGLVMAALGVLGPASQNSWAGAQGAQDWTQIWQEHEWAFVVDARRCIGCGRCVDACKTENAVPLDHEVTRTWVEQYLVGPGERVTVRSPHGGIKGFQDTPAVDGLEKAFFVPKLCNQCKKPPCVQVCPVAATYQTGDGVILVDRERCIGCRYCIQACPYGARFLHPQFKVADKCTWCYHRIVKGLLPACVQACPTGTRMFGDLKKEDSSVKKILSHEATAVLKQSMGTEPQVYYLGMDRVVI